MKILIFTDWFEPAYKAGGPVRSIVNLVQHLIKFHEIYVFTSDRDLNQHVPFSEITTGKWIKQGSIHIFYYAPGGMTFRAVNKHINRIGPDRIYLNSMFSNMFIPLLTAYRSGKVIIAPRGMLKASALAHKSLKKHLYLRLLKICNIEKYVDFHAANTQEYCDIGRSFPGAKRIVIAPNIPVQVAAELMPSIKKSGELRILFSARLHPIKNLSFLLGVLKEISGNVELNIAVIREDPDYYEICRQMAQTLPDNIAVQWLFDLTPSDLMQCVKRVHLFVLPTFGESFGHSIFEAMSVGCPVLISDQTPWKNLLPDHAGMDLDLNQASFAAGLNFFIQMDDAVWHKFRLGAWQLAKRYVESMDLYSNYERLFTER